MSFKWDEGERKSSKNEMSLVHVTFVQVTDIGKYLSKYL